MQVLIEQWTKSDLRMPIVSVRTQWYICIIKRSGKDLIKQNGVLSTPNKLISTRNSFEHK